MCKNNPGSRDFKGVWIPKNLYFNNNLNWTAKILLTEIDSLDHGEGCFASNAYLAEFLQVSRDWLKHLLVDMKRKGLIVVTEEDGHRLIRVVKTGIETPSAENKHEETQSDEETEVPKGYTIQLNADQEDAVNTIYDFWNSFKDVGNGKWHVHTKVSYAIRLAVVQNLERWSVEDICGAIDNYAKVLLNEGYYWDYTWSLPAFLTSERSGGDKKWWQFMTCNFSDTDYAGKKSEPKSNKDIPVIIPDDLNPDITSRLIKMYKNMTNSQRFEPSPKQVVQFIEAARMLVEFYKPYPMVEKMDRIRLLRQELERKYIEAGETLNVGNLCSKYTWDTLMPQAMRELGYIE